jgi:hypothetical protein
MQVSSVKSRKNNLNSALQTKQAMVCSSLKCLSKHMRSEVVTTLRAIKTEEITTLKVVTIDKRRELK